MSDGGLLIDGLIVPVDGLHVLPPTSHGGPLWCQLDPGDYQMRRDPWIRQIIVHTTKGQWPQRVIDGAGAPGKSQIVADFWRGDPTHSAAQIVVDLNGDVACLCDLALVEAYHAEGSNPWSIGIEMYQQSDGSLYGATLSATALLVMFLCKRMGIPQQMPRGPYRNQPLQRMETVLPISGGGGSTKRLQLGGPGLVGVFGHRDNTSNRGAGDPGDEIFRRLNVLGFEPLDYDAKEDILLGKERQAALNSRGERLIVDGVVGPASIAAMLRHGFVRWRDVA